MWRVDPGKRENSEVYHKGDGYSYLKNRQVQDADGASSILYLRCQKFRDGCPGTASIRVTVAEQEWVDGEAHICHRDYQASGERHMRAELRREAREAPFDDPRAILDAVSIRYPNNVAERLRLPKIRGSIRRARNFPDIPPTLQALDHVLQQPQNAALGRTKDGSDLLYAGLVGPPGHRSMVFMSRRVGRFMYRHIRVVFSDPTFTPTPIAPHGCQVFQMSCMINNNVIPLVVAIMETRSYVAYRALFGYIHTAVPRFYPQIGMLDYEYQEQQAMSDEFPNCFIVGCYVHFVRAIAKKSASMGLKRLANRDHRLKSLLRAFAGLALLPQELIKRGFKSLVRRSITRGYFMLLLPFLHYFMKTWLLSWRFGTMSVYGQPNRTNNASESCNRMLRRRTGAHHPTLWKFLKAVQDHEHSAYLDIRCWRRGEQFGRNRRAAVVGNDRNIRNFTRDLLRGHITIRQFCYRASNRVFNLYNMHM